MSDQQVSAVSLDFGHYFFVLRRQWRVIVVMTILGAVAALGYLLVVPMTATASTTLNLNVITTEPFSAQRSASNLLDDATETAIARSHIVASRASDQLKGRVSAAEIRSSSTVTTTSGAAVVTVTYEASSATAAIQGADAVASAYLSYRGEQADQRIGVMVTKLTDRINELNTTLETVNRQLASADPSSVDFAQATTQRQQILTELDGLLSERNGLQSVDTTGGTVLTAAEDNEIAYAPGRTITLLTGLAGGFILGIVAAFAWNPFDRRLRTGAEVSRELNRPVFATVDPRDARIPASGATADSLRVARERMLVDAAPGMAVLVVDVTHGDRVSATALNLAVVTAQAGYGVSLFVPEGGKDLDAVLRPALVLRDETDGESVSSTVPTLRTFAATDVGDERQGDLLLTAQTHAALEDAGDDSLAFLVLSSQAHPASILAGLRLAQAVVIVTRDFRTTASELRWIREEADGIDTPILGAVVESGARRAFTRPRSARRG
jgi:capsular polysaccharide biosynthesis protein